jgi:citrate lyase subunit beta/citryl-CoA lyase
MTILESARVMLFVPGNRPDRFAKAVSAGADLVVLDLEDAVPPAEKDAARDAVRDFLAAGAAAAVRINAAGTEWHTNDLTAVADRAAAVMLPKAEPGSALSAVGAALQSVGTPLLALVESARGVLGAHAVAETAGVQRLAFGSFDLALELGTDPLDHESLAAIRTAVVLASAAAGLVGPVDGVRAAIDDEDGLRAETARARRLGFTGKLCIHPRQIATVRQELAPTPEQIAWARSVLAAADPDTGVVTLNGAMVDRPVVARARQIADRAGNP